MKNSLFAFILLCLNASAFAMESDGMGIVAPYLGRLSSSYSNPKYHLHLDETGNMAGLYGQWINPKYFQANAFFFYSPKAEMTDALGARLNADYYPVEFSFGKLVTGLDLEWIQTHTNGSVRGLDSFDLKNRVAVFMPRVGVSVPILEDDLVSVSAFPYAGVTYETVSGDASMDPTGNAPKMVVPIASESTYASLGLNVTLNLMHLFEIQGKYLGGFKNAERLDSFGALLNVYVSRSVAVSYRYRNDKLSQNSYHYHLLGLAVVI